MRSGGWGRCVNEGENYEGEKTVTVNMEKGWCVNEGENLEGESLVTRRRDEVVS